MKFLVLALCVCAASAASLGEYKKNDFNLFSKPQQVAQAFAAPVVKSLEVITEVPVVAADVAYKTAQIVAEVPIVAARTVYTAAAKDTYNQESGAAIVRSETKVEPDGFEYYYETSNGIAAQASGSTRKVNNEDVFGVQGSYKYNSPDGRPVQISYVADENGYQPQGDVLPVGPAIPEYIIRSLEYIYAHLPKPEVKTLSEPKY